jgi:hypothetical protein
VRKLHKTFPKEDPEERTQETGLIAKAVDKTTSLPITHPQAANQSMVSEETLPGRLFAGATDEPARSFRPSEENLPAQAGRLLPQSLKNPLPHLRRSLASSFKRLCLGLFFDRNHSRRSSVVEEPASTSARPDLELLPLPKKQRQLAARSIRDSKTPSRLAILPKKDGLSENAVELPTRLRKPLDISEETAHDSCIQPTSREQHGPGFEHHVMYRIDRQPRRARRLSRGKNGLPSLITNRCRTPIPS